MKKMAPRLTIYFWGGVFFYVYFGDTMVCIYVKPKYESHACNLGQVLNNVTLAKMFQPINRKTSL